VTAATYNIVSEIKRAYQYTISYSHKANQAGAMLSLAPPHKSLKIHKQNKDCHHNKHDG